MLSVGNKKKQKPSSQEKANPWIYTVSKLYEPGPGSEHETVVGDLMVGRRSPTPRRRRRSPTPQRRRWALVLALLLCLVIAAGLVILLVVR